MMVNFLRWAAIDFLDQLSHLSLIISLKFHDYFRVLSVALSSSGIHFQKPFLELLISSSVFLHFLVTIFVPSFLSLLLLFSLNIEGFLELFVLVTHCLEKELPCVLILSTILSSLLLENFWHFFPHFSHYFFKVFSNKHLSSRNHVK